MKSQTSCYDVRKRNLIWLSVGTGRFGLGLI